MSFLKRLIATSALCAAVLGLAAAVLAQPAIPQTGFCVEVEPWGEASALFRSDPRWLGGDGASSVDLGGERVLWLFGDSFVDPGGSSSRLNASLVRNSVALQKGKKPESAKMEFFWKMLGNRPRSYFREEDGSWFWPGSGVRLGDILIVFLVEVRRAENPLGFSAEGSKAVIVPNPDDPPSLWAHLRASPAGRRRILVGSACALVEGGYLYAFGSDASGTEVHSLRWPVDRAARGDLSSPEWWMGPDAGWASSPRGTLNPRPVFVGAQTEFSIHFEPDLKGFIQVQTLTLANPCLAVRFSPAIERGWTEPACLHDPSRPGKEGIVIYAGKAHKVFEGASLAFTYVVNTLDAETLLNDRELYYPVVLKGHLSPCSRPTEVRTPTP